MLACYDAFKEKRYNIKTILGGKELNKARQCIVVVVVTFVAVVIAELLLSHLE